MTASSSGTVMDPLLIARLGEFGVSRIEPGSLLSAQVERAKGPVRVATALSHPLRGSGRYVDSAGKIQRNPANRALEFPANKIIDRMFSKLYENPWADMPFDACMRERFTRLSEFRPEVSWFGSSDTLRIDVASTLEKIAWLAHITTAPTDEVLA